MGSNCCKGDAAARPLRSGSSTYTRRSRAGASLDERCVLAGQEGAGGARLTISAASADDAGVYTLRASNAAGSDTARVTLEVDEAPTGDDPPTFLRRLQDLTVKVGARTRFLVEIVSSTECQLKQSDVEAKRTQREIRVGECIQSKYGRNVAISPQVFLNKLKRYENDQDTLKNTHIRLLQNELIYTLRTDPTSNEINELIWRLLSFLPNDEVLQNDELPDLALNGFGARWQVPSNERNVA